MTGNLLLPKKPTTEQKIWYQPSEGYGKHWIRYSPPRVRGLLKWGLGVSAAQKVHFCDNPIKQKLRGRVVPEQVQDLTDFFTSPELAPNKL